MKVNVLLAQLQNSFNIEDNLNKTLSIINLAEPDELVVFQEGSLSGYSDDISFLDKIDPIKLQNAMNILKKKVIAKKIHLIFGSCVKEKDSWFNAGLCYSYSNDDFIYKKINLATHERGHFQAGNELKVLPLNLKNGKLNIGIQLCREIRFPEQWKMLALNNADLFVYLTNAITGNNLEIWRSHLISRAAENQRYLISSNVAHEKQHCPTMIVAPNGNVLREIVSKDEQYIRQQLDMSEVSNWYLKQSRTDIVKVVQM